MDHPRAGHAVGRAHGPGQTIGVSVFADRFIEDLSPTLSLTRDQVGAAYLVGTLSGAALLLWVGRQIDRRGVRIAGW